ncbi:type III pantothenate kinase [Paraburkholderia hayleyella]|uniref:type III pantothenate kinase n=1 Tax=Paraburkholderia hayleyella TaxID=2152889 RepID=UPI001290E29F|nr:type III pantothenate kinase [Paraburkholderia hayleyella]
MSASAPFLLIDAGNSRVKWALAQADGTVAQTGAFTHAPDPGAHTAAEATQSTQSAEAAASLAASIAAWRQLPRPGSVWLSNVAGAAVAQRLTALLNAHWPGLPCTTIRAQAHQCGVTNGYTTPSTLGSDRWAGLIGAHAAFPGEALLLATLGTATTLEALRADGSFIGGLIAPGWSLMMRSLGEHTAQLPTLDAQAARGLLAHSPQHGPWFASDTRHSVSAGCALAQASLIERMWHDLSDTWQTPVRLVLGGGAADEVSTMLQVPHTRHDTLVLSGLARIAAASLCPASGAFAAPL